MEAVTSCILTSGQTHRVIWGWWHGSNCKRMEKKKKRSQLYRKMNLCRDINTESTMWNTRTISQQTAPSQFIEGQTVQRGRWRVGRGEVGGGVGAWTGERLASTSTITWYSVLNNNVTPTSDICAYAKKRFVHVDVSVDCNAIYKNKFYNMLKILWYQTKLLKFFFFVNQCCKIATNTSMFTKTR